MNFDMVQAITITGNEKIQINKPKTLLNIKITNNKRG